MIASFRVFRPAFAPLAACALLLASILPARAATPPDDTLRARRAIEVLREVQDIPESAIPDKLLDEALSAAEAINAFSGPSVMLAKECVNRAFESGLSDGVSYERRVFHALFATEDQKEGMDAFVNKRKPAFKHR